MASPRFRVLNGNGGTIIADHKARGINYLGRATLISTTPASGSVGSLQGKGNGFSYYEFTWPSMVCAAVQLRSGCTVWMQVGGTPRSGNTWRWWVHCGNDSLDVNDFAAQEAPELYVFGRMDSASGTGLRIRDDQGNLTHAYTDGPNPPLWCRTRLSETGGSVDTATARNIGLMSKPAALGWPRHRRIARTWTSAAAVRQEEWQYGWRWNATAPGQVLLLPAKAYQNRDPEAGPPPGNDSDIVTASSSETFLINAANL